MRVRSWLPILSFAACSAGVEAAPPAPGAKLNAVAPSEHRPVALSKRAPALLFARQEPARTIALPEPRPVERAAMAGSGRPPAPAKGHPVQIGFGRDVPVEHRVLALSTLRWQAAADGSRVARVVVDSAGAAALRLRLALSTAHPELVLRFAGDGVNAEVQGPHPASEIAEANAREGGWWSPVLEGSRAVVEIAAGPGVALGGVTLTLARVAHLTLAGDALRPGGPGTRGVGDAGTCNFDVSCVIPQTQALIDMTKATARIVFTQTDGGVYSCSATLLNDSVSSNTPYLFTASHCIDSAQAAATLNVYWFYQSTACGLPNLPGPYKLQTSGAKLLGRSLAEDWSLVQLKAPPPAGVYFAAWRAEPNGVPPGEAAATLHNPQADLMKYSSGNALGNFLIQVEGEGGGAGPNSELAAIRWTQGTTESGSSGSALLTYFAPGGYYEVRGSLAGGTSSCQFQIGADYFSRVEKMLPLMRQYLTPNVVDAEGLVVVVEYYNRGLDHYFITSNPAEIRDLDAGVHPGWVRTGLRFLAYDRQAPGTNPVCRFYRAPAYGDSHFYSASPAECAATAAAHPVDWIYEGANVFYIALPSIFGNCPAGTHPMWRFYNNRTVNHRYTADVSVRDNLRATPGWIAEGYGADAVIMCSPNGS
jgi:hypothetical protein